MGVAPPPFSAKEPKSDTAFVGDYGVPPEGVIQFEKPDATPPRDPPELRRLGRMLPDGQTPHSMCIRVVEAGGILHEMMEKGLKPNFPVYVKVMEDLHKMSRGDWSSQLKSMFLKFTQSKEAG